MSKPHHSATPLTGQVAIVTGGSRGIGRAISLAAQLESAAPWSPRRPPAC